MTSLPAPDSDDLWARIDAVADAAGPPHDYEAFLANAPASHEDYLFSARTVRFDVRDGDCLFAPRDLSVRATPTGVELGAPSLAGTLRVDGVEVVVAKNLLARFDGERDLGDVRRTATTSESQQLERLLSATFGRLLFAPLALSALEARISGAELTRFVGTPYEVERRYWENMRDLRELSQSALAAARDANAFVRALRRLHVITLLGAGLRNFYRPASRTSSHGVQPGALYRAEVRWERRGAETILLEGPRVGVPFVGGLTYHSLVCAHDPEALAERREIRDADGLSWGCVVHGRAQHENDSRAWFLPPRPFEPAHLERLYVVFDEARRAATQGDGDALVPALARFHFRFVRLHPFRCANQSLCMNLVNGLLLAGVQKTMPHGLLDQFALRLNETAYEVVFGRAAKSAPPRGNAAARWGTLQQQTRDVYALIERLQKTPEAASARSLAMSAPRAAAAALIA